MTFDPKKHIIRIQGNREYLPVAARLIWFRQDHPDWGIVTNPVEINMEKQYAIFSCSIFNEEGKVMATATKMENVRGFQDYLEKAETGSVGRALAYVGYGTQFAPELEEESRFADSPYGGNGGNAPRPSGPGGYNGNGGSGNGGYGGNGGNSGARPAPTAPQAQTPAPTPARRPAPPVASDGGGNGNNAVAPANANANANSTGGVQRVREPERAAEYEAPDEEEEEDDFFDEEDGLTAAETAPVAAPSTPAPVTAPSVPRANPLAGNRCSVEGCSNVLTAGQMTMSEKKFGRPVCLLHQKDVQPIADGGGAPAPASGGARRGGGGRGAAVAETDGE